MKRKANIFGWGKKAAPEAPRRRSSLTIASASKRAREAGYRGKDFREFLELSALMDRSQLALDRLGDSYRAGMDARERDDQQKIDAREAAREKKRVKAEARDEGKQRAEKLSKVDEDAMRRHFDSGGSIKSFLAQQNPARRKMLDRQIRSLASRHSRNPLPVALIAPVNDYLGYQLTGAAVAKGAKYGSKLVRAATKGRRNPATEAAEAYEDFHGRPPEEFVTVKRKVHVHRHLAGAGTLRKLVVKTEDGKARVSIKFYSGSDPKKRTLLAFNKKRNQLFIEGGDQAVNLKDFGISRPHELETLGKVLSIDYFTTKDHLGDEGGTAVYGHKFRTVNQDGQHVTVRVARYPDLIYRVLDKQLEFSGGSYEILAEGINQ